MLPGPGVGHGVGQKLGGQRFNNGRVTAKKVLGGCLTKGGDFRGRQRPSGANSESSREAQPLRWNQGRSSTWQGLGQKKRRTSFRQS
jgi:hypothetical protein